MIIGVSLRENIKISLVSNLRLLSNIVSIKCKSMQQTQDTNPKMLLVLIIFNSNIKQIQ